MNKLIYTFLLALVFTNISKAQAKDSVFILLENPKVQIESTDAVNNLYNYRFERADLQFGWLQQEYPWHPLGYFLRGLSEWWKILPNMQDKSRDARFHAYMDSAIILAENLYKRPPNKVEASFFLAAAYGFKGRLLSEREEWVKAASAGKKSLKYLEDSEEFTNLSPEFLFGHALYNYYSVWIPENYPALKPILIFFKKGEKDLGIKQLREVANNAFYTRTEAQHFLVKILNSERKDRSEALLVAKYLSDTYPRNSVFLMYYARLLYNSGQWSKMEPECKKIMTRVDSSEFGYGPWAGKYASFFLGEYYKARRDNQNAKYYYERAVEFGEVGEMEESGYHLYSLLNLLRIADEEGDHDAAETYVKDIKSNSDRKHPANEAAREYLKERRKEKKEGKFLGIF
ncbi:tetratricopeptide repeat protein [Marinigracilibium pacificum]|uniref:Tol-pal system protein YbgF n=1 Tax=Marinigracilibium pacificum TaxID=2729599 RepID=A0A848J378_9BACT|nr:tol-pal system protein YbgF [Marinigracilibium pacificum]NMM48799.1 tol-pal system protein YbgF [Marinigracilibium pacificum]